MSDFGGSIPGTGKDGNKLVVAIIEILQCVADFRVLIPGTGKNGK